MTGSYGLSVWLFSPSWFLRFNFSRNTCLWDRDSSVLYMRQNSPVWENKQYPFFLLNYLSLSFFWKILPPSMKLSCLSLHRLKHSRIPLTNTKFLKKCRHSLLKNADFVKTHFYKQKHIYKNKIFFFKYSWSKDSLKFWVKNKASLIKEGVRPPLNPKKLNHFPTKWKSHSKIETMRLYLNSIKK